MHGIESQEYWSFSAAATAFSSMAFGFVLRWWYFDVAHCAAPRHVVTREQAVRFQIWHYAHLPMFLGIAVAGVGFEHLISLEAGEHLTRTEVAVLCSAVAVLMAALTVIAATSDACQKRTDAGRHFLSQFGLAMAVVIIGALAPGLHRVLLAGGMLAVCCGQTLLSRVPSNDSEHVTRLSQGNKLADSRLPLA
jgi:low temperature requirement protein LtrA